MLPTALPTMAAVGQIFPTMAQASTLGASLRMLMIPSKLLIQ